MARAIGVRMQARAGAQLEPGRGMALLALVALLVVVHLLPQSILHASWLGSFQEVVLLFRELLRECSVGLCFAFLFCTCFFSA